MAQPERLQQIESLFHQALERAPGERFEFVAAAAVAEDVRHSVLALIEHAAVATEGVLAFGGSAGVSVRGVGSGVGSGAGAGISGDRRPVPGSLTPVLLEDLPGEVPVPPLGEAGGRYVVLDHLGSGGMGIVLLVFDRELGRRVALKTSLFSDPAATAQFIAEAQVVGQLQHPNIVPLYDIGTTAGGQAYYTMPVLGGATLAARLAARGSVSANLAEMIQIFLQVCHAVSYAHARGVLHRDLKPGNVMLGAHGEVMVLDWGLALLRRNAADPPRMLVGTPGYLAPEQAAGRPLGVAADVYGLGAILYEILAGEPAWSGTTEERLKAAACGPPASPSQRSRARAARAVSAGAMPAGAVSGASVPVALERVCLEALAVDPAKRPSTVATLRAVVAAWADAEAERTVRRERGAALARTGEDKLQQLGGLDQDEQELIVAEADAAAAVQPWQPLADKQSLLAIGDRRTALRKRRIELASEVVTTLTAALEEDHEQRRARTLLADYYWSRMVDAEARRDAADAELNGRLVRAYGGKRHLEALSGDGALELDSDPPGAAVRIHRLIERQLVLCPDAGVDCGVTPLRLAPLEMGSYLVVLRRAGARDVRYPVLIRRGQQWRGLIRLHADEAIGPEFVCVPGGPFEYGGDPGVVEWAEPRTELWLDDFCIAVHPVTMAQYLEFVNDVAAADPQAARGLAPRRTDGSLYYEPAEGGRLKIAEEPDAEGDRIDPDWPVVAISHRDAAAYAAWRSARDGVAYRLPSEQEWEKAARGVDGRFFPWGNRFDSSLCNVRDSQRQRPAPLPVGAVGADRSTYGVAGMAGNSADWTASEVRWGEGAAARFNQVTRGGSWAQSPANARAAHRIIRKATLIRSHCGFRLARDPAGKP